MQLPYQARHIDVPLMLSGQTTLPYPPRASFARSDDMPPPSHFDNNAANAMPAPFDRNAVNAMPVWKRGEKEFSEELMRVMLGIAKLVEPLMDKNGNFPYHLFGRSA
jgi:DNA (cytosine-5)-methyltransferase 3A